MAITTTRIYQYDNYVDKVVPPNAVGTDTKQFHAPSPQWPRVKTPDQVVGQFLEF
jgi:hypothetical protein